MAPFEDSHNNFVKYTDQQGNSLAAIVRDGTVQAQQVEFGDGSVQTTASGASGGTVLSHTATVTSAQLLAGGVVGLIPAPLGVKQFLNVLEVVVEYVFATTPYNSGGTMVYGFSGAQARWLAQAPSNLLQNVTSTVMFLPMFVSLSSGAQLPTTTIVNAPFEATISPAFTGGDGSLLFHFTYTIETSA